MDLLQRAISLSQIYLEIFPDDHVEWTSLGFHHRQKDDLKEAEKIYKKALEIDPNYSRAITGLAFLYRQTREYEKALNLLRRDMVVRPDSPHPWVRMASIQFEMATGVGHKLVAKTKNLEEAIKLMEKAAKFRPSSWGIRQDLALYYWLKGDLEKAIENQQMMEELKRID